jgi:hypothetical protein
MDRVKTLFKYALWIILFWILSDVLIYFGINSTYKDIEKRNEISSQITIDDAEATTVNGRILGSVTNSEDNDISEKYLKVDLYSDIGNLVGTNFLEIGNLGTIETKSFETYFKIQNVKSYEINIVDKKIVEEAKNQGITGNELFMTENISQIKLFTLIIVLILK